MRITESQLRRIIRNEIRRSMLSEGHLDEMDFGGMAKKAAGYGMAALTGMGGMYAADRPEQTKAALSSAYETLSGPSGEQQEIEIARKAIGMIDPSDYETRETLELYIEDLEDYMAGKIDNRPELDAGPALDALNTAAGI